MANWALASTAIPEKFEVTGPSSQLHLQRDSFGPGIKLTGPYHERTLTCPSLLTSIYFAEWSKDGGGTGGRWWERLATCVRVWRASVAKDAGHSSGRGGEQVINPNRLLTRALPARY